MIQVFYKKTGNNLNQSLECNNWTYSSWSSCQSNGIQTRTITSSFPSGCSGGYPVLTQSCNYYPEIEYSDYNFTYRIERLSREIIVHFTNPTNRDIVIKSAPVTVEEHPFESLGIYLRYRPRPGAVNTTIFLEKVNKNYYKFIGPEVSIKQPTNYFGIYDRFVTLSSNQDVVIDTDIKSWIIWDKDANRQVLIN